MTEERSNGAAWRPTKPRQETACYLCPCSQLTAYWTSPPTCPRRVCCETKSCCIPFCFRDAKALTIFVASIFISYFVIMDIILYCYFQKANLVEGSKGGSLDEIYTPFTHLSVKALLNDQPSQYLIAPSTEWLEYFTNFANIFYFITPNVVSFMHLIVGFISGKFVASENLNDRRIAVVLFEFRTWLDAFDGTVFRAQPGNHLKYNSIHSTLGYYIDSTFDIFGGVFFCFGIFFYLLKKYGPPRMQWVLPFWSSGNGDAQTKAPLVSEGGNESHHSALYLFLKIASFGLVLIVSATTWDNIVVQFSEVFQTQLKDPALSALQLQICHSNTTVFIFQLWRLIGSQCMLNYLLLIVFFDKIWEFLKGTQFVLLIMIISLYGVSVVYVNQIKVQLHL